MPVPCQRRRADNCTKPGCAFVGNHAFASEFPRPNSGGALFPNHTDTEFSLTPNRGEVGQSHLETFQANFPALTPWPNGNHIKFHYVMFSSAHSLAQRQPSLDPLRSVHLTPWPHGNHIKSHYVMFSSAHSLALQWASVVIGAYPNGNHPKLHHVMFSPS